MNDKSVVIHLGALKSAFYISVNGKKVFYSETNEILYYHELDWNGVRVWGATAKILIDLFNLIKTYK